MFKINKKIALILIGFLTMVSVGGAVVYSQYNTVKAKGKDSTIAKSKDISDFSLPFSSEKAQQTSLKGWVLRPKVFDPKVKIKLPVLMYHRINNLAGVNLKDGTQTGLRVSPEVFDKQLDYIEKKGYKTITAEDLFLYTKGIKELPDKPILLTLDDGFMDNYTNAFPILKKHNMVGDFAIITHVTGSGEYMGLKELKELVEAGMGISSHTVMHCYLAVNVNPKTATSGPFRDSPVVESATQKEQGCPDFTSGIQLNTSQIYGELKNSKEFLEKNLDIKVHSVVYPYGKYNAQVIKIAQDLGYYLGFTVEPEGDDYNINIQEGAQAMSIPRIRVFGQQTGAVGNFI
ncbi:MAG: polysaccharide deacetylase family protein [bacterium]